MYYTFTVSVMAAYGESFLSERSVEEKKEKRRIARQDAVEEARQQYEREEKKMELKRRRGEDTWILPEVNQRLQQMSEPVLDPNSLQEACHKKKKKKKENKSKKKKKKQKKTTVEGVDGSTESSQNEEDEWVEAPPESTALKAWKPTESKACLEHSVQRDEWMTFDFLAMRTTSTAERKAEREQQKEEESAQAQARQQANLQKLELNPYWKDGGSGLPPEEKLSTAVKKGEAVNDGGVGWLKKSLQRMKEQAQREQRSLDDVVTERYGSMQAFDKKLAEADKAVYRGGGAAGAGRSEGEEEARERWWRRERERKSSPSHRERHQRVGQRDGERHRMRDRENRDRERHRERDTERCSERDRENRDGERHRERDTERCSERDRENRDGERRRERDTERCSERDRENRDGERRRERDKGRCSERDGVADNLQDVPVHRQSLWSGERGSVGLSKSRFLKPSDDDCIEGPVSLQPLARPSSAFLKSTSDEEDSGHQSTRDQAWKKPTQDSAIQLQEKERDAGKSPAVTSLRSESSSEEEETEEMPLLTEEEMNKLGAQLVKAEILCNTVLVEKLKSQLEAARTAKDKHAALKLQAADGIKQVLSSDHQEVLLFRTDRSGRAWPVQAPSGPQDPHGKRRRKKEIETHVEGQRVRYFQNDDVGLQELVRREKMSLAQDQNALYSRMATKMMGKTDGDNYTLDDMFVSSAAQREGEGMEEQRMRSRAIRESRSLEASMDKCQQCFSSSELQKHLIVALGSKVYLSLPVGVSMTEGHCLICPLQHHCCATGLDEEVWAEMQMFRRALVRMFESQELDCVFMETCMNLRRKQHMVLECIPLPRELGDMAPIYFKKAILECDEEWAMNKKIINLSSKDVRQAIPHGFPYFAVDFGLQGGFAHVIENEQKFPHYFGKEVVGGMMDLEPRRWRKSIRENFDNQRKKVLQFAQWWKLYDCTKTHS
ncbi:CWF19-like protein 2 isoform X2 [Genypterus blacodes]|uniref:CWF19-like protein 2 isoform X2 n=1 Tax=Genypterus blacodes TaxID=154954 RepID=UPI003F768708